MTMWFVYVSIFLRVTLFFGSSKTVKVPSFEVNNSGINHNSACPTSCLNSRCHFNNSRVICTDGCEEGRRGDNCSVDCPPKCSDCSKYPGDSCEELCLDNCEGGCDRYKWQCASCKPGFTGRFCDTCMKGFSGARCKNKCPDYCHDGCRKEIGFCSWRDDAYRGRYCIRNSSELCLECESNGLCKHCFPYFWGYGCNQACPAYCDESGCNRHTGKCGGCIDGYWGDICNLSCPTNCDRSECKRQTGKCGSCIDGYWGDFCNQTCPTYCDGPGCNRHTGKCLCSNVYWGDFCNQTCPTNCDEPGCNRQTGKCGRCIDGYWGDFCNHICPANCDRLGCVSHGGRCLRCNDGYWGYFCNQTCSTNCGKLGCYEFSGECRCDDGYWGYNCTNACPTNCDLCSDYSGKCLICNDGYWGDNCKKICPIYCDLAMCNSQTGYCSGCPHGYWGNICSQTCPNNCHLSECDMNTGQCRRCINGHFGSFCNITRPPNCISYRTDTGQCFGCKNGYRSHFCSMSCFHHCSLCDRFTGDCYSCESGYQGGFCNETCPSNCKRGCNRYTGVCVACVDGYTGRHCNSACSPHCEICDFDTGHCLGCITGKKGQFCKQSCPSACVSCDMHNEECGKCRPGYKGKYCNCSDNCEGCDEITGYCISCIRGKKGQFCNESCRSSCVACGMYNGECLNCRTGYRGKNCLCGDNCKICNPITGQCERCKHGLNGQFCNETCPNACSQCERYGKICKGPCVNDSYYGESCSIPCSESCAGCEKATGSCLNCAQGYSRVYCDEMCTLCSQPGNCISNSCINRSSSWLWMVLVGTLSSFCTFTLSVLVWVKQARKVRRSDERQEDPGSIPVDPPDPHEYHLPSNHYHEIADTAPECDPLSQSLPPPLPAPRTTTTIKSKIRQETKHLESDVPNFRFLSFGARPLLSCRESAKGEKDQGIRKRDTDALSLPPPLSPPPKEESHTPAKSKLLENAQQISDNFQEFDHGFRHPPRTQILVRNKENLHEEINLDSYCVKDFISVPLKYEQESQPASCPLRGIQSKNLVAVAYDTTAQSHPRSRTLLPNSKPPCDTRRMLMDIRSHEPALSFVFEADEVFENPFYRKSEAPASNNVQKIEVGECHAFGDQKMNNGFRKVNLSYVEMRNRKASEPNLPHMFLERRFSESDLLKIEWKMTESHPQIKRSKSDIIRSEKSYFALKTMPNSFVSLQNDFANLNSEYMYITPVMEQKFSPKPIQ